MERLYPQKSYANSATPLIAENEGQRPKASSFTPINYASSKAAIPGKILPSNNSKLAPPPVEMWLI